MGTRHSPRPLWGEGYMDNSGANRAAGMRVHILTSLRGAKATTPLRSLRELRSRKKARVDCFRLRAQALRRTPTLRSSRSERSGVVAFAPRNDVGVHVLDHAARVRPGCACILASREKRAQGMPGARCARSVACEIKKHTRIVATVTPG